MITGFIAKKIAMTSVFTPEGKRISVTELKAEPIVVTQVKTTEKDGYVSLQTAYGLKKHMDNSTKSRVSKAKLTNAPKGFIEFFPVNSEEMPTVGTSLKVADVLKDGDAIAVTGTTKGRGFAGVIKRHGFQRQPVTGGQSDRTRAPGAIGAQTPGKVLKGKKMPGHMGNVRHTVLNLTVYKVDSENNTILVTGSVPGHRNSWVVISK